MAAPFEWLSGGLFFSNKTAKGGGIESVDSCKDVLALLNGINEAFDASLTEEKPPVDEQISNTESSNTAEESDPNSNKEPPTQSRLLAARLSRVRFLLYDERSETSKQDSRRSSAPVATDTMKGLTGDSLRPLIPKLLDHLHDLPFESRKHAAAIFNYLLVCGLDGADRDLYLPAMTGFRDYVNAHFEEILTPIVKGHECLSPGVSDVCLHCGSMYRSCFKHPCLYRQLVSTTERLERYLFPFLDKFVHVPNFDVSSDAMESLKMIFTAGGSDAQVPADEESQKQMADAAADFLEREYEAIWDQRFNPKLLSDQASYMTKRMALQILSTVLLTRSNYAIMIKYVNSRANLILVMHLLRDTSPHITLDAFHVFKVFVANPNKIPEVIKILHDNGPKLCRYLETLHQDREANDTQFRDEKALIIATIQAL
jgi:calcium binding protein 39